MQVIFSRHGNTFAPGEPVVWVGAKQDIPLVESGFQQASNLAKALREANIPLTAVYCSSLKRTREYATELLKELQLALKPIIDVRLNEIDYGNWSGLTKSQIQAIDARQELSAWENESIWPKMAGWLGSAAQMEKQAKDFVEDLIAHYRPTDTVLLITSNGRLRYFLTLSPGAFVQHVQNRDFKVATGNICLFVYRNKQWQLKFWNKNPHYLTHLTQ